MTIPMYSLEIEKFKKIYIKTLDASELDVIFDQKSAGIIIVHGLQLKMKKHYLKT